MYEKERIPTCEFEAERLIFRVHRSIRARIPEVEPVIEHIMGIVTKMGCVEGSEFEVELALREALVNAIIHGSREDPEKIVECCVGCDESRGILIVIRDSGSGFDPAAIPSPTIGQNLYSSHGRGIFLINQLMDDVQYHHGGTEIRMRKG